MSSNYHHHDNKGEYKYECEYRPQIRIQIYYRPIKNRTKYQSVCTVYAVCVYCVYSNLSRDHLPAKPRGRGAYTTALRWKYNQLGQPSLLINTVVQILQVRLQKNKFTTIVGAILWAVTTSPAVLNTLSDGTFVAGIHRKCLASFVIWGYSSVFGSWHRV